MILYSPSFANKVSCPSIVKLVHLPFHTVVKELQGGKWRLLRIAGSRDIVYLERENMLSAVSVILKELRRRLNALYGKRLARVVLFGSRARGDAGPGSDIDVLVVLKGKVSPSQEIDRTVGITADVSLKHNVVVSCVFVSETQYRKEQSPLLLNVRREGVVV